MAALHICWTEPRVELKREPDRVRWCFKCRRRLSHDYVLMGYQLPDQMPSPDDEDQTAWEAFLGSQAAWYEPSWELKCSGCGFDCTRMWG